MISYLIIVFFLVVVVLVLDQLDHFGDIKFGWAALLGIISAISGIFQFVPQVVHTGMTREFGSLSLSTLLMQSPGSFVFAYSLSIQPGTNWTSWISFVICGMLQGILVLMWVIFYFFPVQKQEDQERLLQDELEVQVESLQPEELDIQVESLEPEVVQENVEE
ncbi:hypothetical protein HDV06_002788 [Boothiomyces sp. JEL0866]|nr:hypothetical protein HDV06_002788 [Boothiomyces sp. JEL0866]